LIILGILVIGVRIMAKKKMTQSDRKKLRIQQIIVISVGLIIILSMVLSLVK
jgi:hypothetical protein